jgi:hypothetical protein
VAFEIYLEFTGMCLVLSCLHLEEPALGSEEGGSQLMHNTENFFILFFVCFFTVWCST